MYHPRIRREEGRAGELILKAMSKLKFSNWFEKRLWSIWSKLEGVHKTAFELMQRTPPPGGFPVLCCNDNNQFHDLEPAEEKDDSAGCELREFLAREILAISRSMRFCAKFKLNLKFSNNMSEFLEMAKTMFTCSKLGTYWSTPFPRADLHSDESHLPRNGLYHWVCLGYLLWTTMTSQSVAAQTEHCESTYVFPDFTVSRLGK